MTPQPLIEASDPALTYSSAYGNHVFLVLQQKISRGRYLVTNAQIDAVERTLIHSLQRTLHCFTSPHITLIEFDIPPPHSATGASIGSPSRLIHGAPHKHNCSKTLQPQVQISLQ